MEKNGRKRWINNIIIMAVLLFGFSVTALAEEPETKTFEKSGVRFAIPEEFMNTTGVLNYWEKTLSYMPPTYWISFEYWAMPEEAFNDFRKQEENDALSEEELSEINNSKLTYLGSYYATKGALTDIPGIEQDADKEVIELGSVDGFNRYYVIEFDADALSNWDEEYVEETEILSDKIVEMLKQAELFKPVDPGAEIIGKKITFKAEDLDHNIYTSEDLFSQNRFTLVNVWGSWCNPCVGELEDLGKFHKQIEDMNCGLLGIEYEVKAYEKFAQEAKDLLKEKNVTYPNILVNDDMDFMKMISSYPSSFFVNNEGIVVSPMYTGSPAKEHNVLDKFTPVLDKLLAE